MKNNLLKITKQFIGMLFYSFGVSAIVFSGLGASPIDAATYYINQIIPVFDNLIPNFTGQGIWLIIFNMIIALVLFIIFRKRSLWINVLVSIAIGILFTLGMFTYGILFSSIVENIYLMILIAFVGINFMAFGIAYLVSKSLYGTPFDELAIKLEETVKKYYLSKIILDGSFLLIAFILGLIYRNVFEQIDFFTVIVLAFLGPFINMYINIIKKIDIRKDGNLK